MIKYPDAQELFASKGIVSLLLTYLARERDEMAGMPDYDPVRFVGVINLISTNRTLSVLPLSFSPSDFIL